MRYPYSVMLNSFQHLEILDPRLCGDMVQDDQRRARSLNLRGKYGPILTATLVNLSVFSTNAHADGLEKAKGVLELIKTEILGIVPIIAVIALIGLGIGYATNSVHKETFMRWAVGLIIIGSAAQITSMLLG